MPDKITLGIIFGGRSVEHEVSVLSGSQALHAADRSKYNVQPIYLDRDNIWYIGDDLENIEFFRRKNPPLNQLTRVFPSPDPMRGKLRLTEAAPRPLRKAKVVEIDCVLPVTHGTFVEDGALQGLLELSGVPFAGSGVHGSAVGMDKLLFKAVLAAEGLPNLPYQQVTRSEWDDNPASVLERIGHSIEGEVFVKPAILGSSVGISHVKNPGELETALDLALKFCDRALVEKALDYDKEINCSVIDGDPPIPSILEQPVSSSDLLTFDEKYKGNAKKGVNTGEKGMAAQKRLIPAPINEEMTRQIQDYAVRTFRAVGAGGVARIDFLVAKDGSVYINELNNIPGSLSFYLWEHMGRSFADLIDRLVELAYAVNKIRNRTIFSFEANLLAGG